jgi:prepilin peptidase CpaA
MEKINQLQMQYQLTPALLAGVILCILSVLLLSAVWSDVKSRRIPNRLVFCGAALGLILNAVLPEGNGFVSNLPGAIGLQQALYGLGLGLGIMLPLYGMRAMGAGDVKLMAMVGAFLGPIAVVATILLTFIAGGLLTIAVVLKNRTMPQLIANVREILLTSFFKLMMKEPPTLEPIPASAGKMPYAIAIMVGTFSYIIIVRSGNASFFGYI